MSTLKLLPTERTFTRELVDRTGTKVVVRVIIDDGYPLDRMIQRLANKVRSSKTRRLATAADGMIRVYIEPDRQTNPILEKIAKAMRPVVDQMGILEHDPPSIQRRKR